MTSASDKITFDDVRRTWLDSTCGAIEAFTSGSTGDPKRIMLPKELMRLSATRTNAFFGIDGSSRLHSCVSPRFVGGKMMMIRALEAGASFTWEEPSNRPLTGIAGDIDLLAVVPSQMPHICKNRALLPALRNIIIGGSALSPQIRKEVASSGLNAYETYGMTETASHIALRKVTEDPCMPFKTLPGVRISLDQRGCLVIRQEGFEDVITNDMAVIYDDGRFNIIGRVDDVIVTGAIKVQPGDMERRISPALPGINYAVSSMSDAKWGEAVVLVIENDACFSEEEIRQLKIRLSATLKPYEMPKAIAFTATLPLTPMGKLNRKFLREMIGGHLHSEKKCFKFVL